MAGKGDKRRPENAEKVRANWDAIKWDFNTITKNAPVLEKHCKVKEIGRVIKKGGRFSVVISMQKIKKQL
jgi:hypothetical protein